MRLVYVQDLAKAIQRATAKNPEKQLEYNAAVTISDYILGFFGFQNRIVDNILEPQDRNLFYSLQDYGLIRTITEETKLWDGREWRIHYWLLDHNKIFNVSEELEQSTEDMENPVDSLYNDLPERLWRGEEAESEKVDWFLRDF